MVHPTIPTGGGVNPSENILSDDDRPTDPVLQNAELFCSVNSESSARSCQIT